MAQSKAALAAHPQTQNGQPSIEQLRANFLNTAVFRSQSLPRQKYEDGGEIQFTLPHAGFGAFVILDFQGSLDITGTGGALTLNSPRAPYNVFNKVTFEDYLGITRGSCSGDQLNERLNTQRHAFDFNNSALAQAYSSTRFNVGIGAGTGAAGTYDWNFATVYPISKHHNTTEGSFPFTISNGDNTITVDLCSSVVGSTVDSPISQTTAGFTPTLSGTVGCTYYYWDVPSGTPLPLADFQLVHELRSVKSTNVNAGDENRYTLRTGRTYLQIIQDLVINNVPDTEDVEEVTFYVDGNTPTLDESLAAYLNRTYLTYGRDFYPGQFVFDFWRKPWTPNDYGSLETSLNISESATVTGTSYHRIFMESMYKTSKIVADLNNLPTA